MPSDRFLAIDFGTSNSSVGYIEGSKINLVDLVDEIQSSKYIPSIVYIPKPLCFDDPVKWVGSTQALVGQAAINGFNQDTARAGKYFASFKPLLKEIARSKASLHFKEDFLGYKEMDYEYLGQVKEGKLTFRWNSNFYHRGYYYSPEELKGAVAVIIETLWKEAVRQTRGREFNGVVMGVPVDFSRLARQRLLEAIEMTGRVAREKIFFVSEPVAIALRYAEEGYEDERYVLVFDYGGGTLDLSLVEYFSNEGAIQFKILNKKGYQFAGRNIDMLLAQAIQKEYIPDLYSRIEAHGYKKINRISEIRDLDFWLAIEHAKIELSEKQTTELDLPRLGIRGLEIKRSSLENGIGRLLVDIKDKVDELLKEVSLPINNVDRVLMAGGSSQIPAVKRLLEWIFPGKVDDRYAGTGTSTEGLALAIERINSFEDVTSHNLYLWEFVSQQPKLFLPAKISLKEASVKRQIERDAGLSLLMEEPAKEVVLLLCEEVNNELIANSFWVVQDVEPFKDLRLIAELDTREGSYRIKALRSKTLNSLQVNKVEIEEDKTMPILEIGNIIRVEQGGKTTRGEVLGIRCINSAEETSFAAGDFTRFVLTVFDPEKLETSSIITSNEQLAVLIPATNKEEYEIRELYQAVPYYKKPFTLSFRYRLNQPGRESDRKGSSVQVSILKDYDPSRTIKKIENDKVFVTVGEKPISHFPFMAKIEGPTTGDGERETIWYLIPRSVAEKYIIKGKDENELRSLFTRTKLYKIVEVPLSEDYLGDK